ncbi:MAG: hypothetical protein ACPHID_03040 [Thermoplasmatota archaeon]
MRPVLPLLLLTVTALAGCSGGGSDSDGDGVSNELELDGWATHTVDLIDRRIAVLMTSDPDLVDTDGDGLTDHQELLARTNPREPDTDFDGLSDCQETFHTVLADCQNPDFDLENEGDGGYPTDPRNADSDPGPARHKLTLPFLDETGTLGPGMTRFGDGISDGEEILGYLVQVGARTVNATSDPRLADTDGDGLEDGEERLYGGNPTVADSDGDGCVDGTDPYPGHAEIFRIVPHNVTLHDAPEGDEARIRLDILAADRLIAIGDQEPIREGEEIDLSHLATEVPTDACNIEPYDGWTRIQAIVFDFESEVHLDGSSTTGRDLYWNVRSGALAWGSADGERLETDRATWSGSHVSFTLQPLVEGV